jgi:glycosyltransferase involved in cell wall biosynthesis
MRLLWMVNGASASAAGVRAREFARRLPPDWEMRFAHRPARKWQGIASFSRTALAFCPNVIYVVDTAYAGVLAGCLSRRLTGSRWVTDTGDAVHELLKSRGTCSPVQLALSRRIEQLALRGADHVVVRGSFHQALLEEQGVPRVTFVPDGVDLDTVGPVDSRALRARLGLGGYLVIGMVGTMSWSRRHRICYGWDVIEALGLMKKLPVRALLVGDGDGRAILERRATELRIRDRVVFTGTVAYNALPEYASAMDICVSTQSNDRVGMVRTTGKLPLYLACGKYVIATDVGEARRVLPGVGCLLPYAGVRDDEYPRRLATHVRQLLAEPELLRCAEGARQVARTHFDYGMLAGRVRGLVQAV